MHLRRFIYTITVSIIAVRIVCIDVCVPYRSRTLTGTEGFLELVILIQQINIGAFIQKENIWSTVLWGWPGRINTPCIYDFFNQVKDHSRAGPVPGVRSVLIQVLIITHKHKLTWE